MNNSFYKNINTNHVLLLLVILFFCLRLPDFIINAYVPDELWHTLHMHDIKNWDYYRVDNYQGHGSAFWYFGALCERFFGDEATFFILRIVSLLSLTATAFLLLFTFNKTLPTTDQQTLFLFSIFILTLPFFWWGGKLIFPEFFQCFLVALAYYFIYVKQRYFIFSFFLLGFCFGLKLHAGAAIAYFVADSFFKNYKLKNINYFLVQMIVLFIGFIVANPVVILDFSWFLRDIQSNGQYLTAINENHFSQFIQHWGNILTGHYPEWDLVYFGGINETAIPLLNFLLLAVMIGFACRKNKLYWLSVFVYAISIFVMLSINQKFLSYYSFTMVTLVILLASQGTNINQKYLTIFLMVSILINMYITVPNIINNRQLTDSMYANLQLAKQHTGCILTSIQQVNHIGLIINNSDVGANAKRETFLLEPLFMDSLLARGLPKDTTIFNNMDTENIFVKEVGAQHGTIKNVLGDNRLLKVNPKQGLPAKIITNLLQNNLQILYLDGSRPRQFDLYAEFLPALTLFISQIAQKPVTLNILYLDECYGTRVNLISINRGK